MFVSLQLITPTPPCSSSASRKIIYDEDGRYIGPYEPTRGHEVIVPCADAEGRDCGWHVMDDQIDKLLSDSYKLPEYVKVKIRDQPDEVRLLVQDPLAPLDFRLPTRPLPISIQDSDKFKKLHLRSLQSRVIKMQENLRTMQQINERKRKRTIDSALRQGGLPLELREIISSSAIEEVD